MNVLDKYWAIKIANYLYQTYDLDKDMVLDLDFEPLDKTTCIVINKEIDEIKIFKEDEKGKIYMDGMVDGNEEGEIELYKALAWEVSK